MLTVTLSPVARKDLDEMLEFYRKADPNGRGMREQDLLDEIIDEAHHGLFPEQEDDNHDA